MSGVIGIDPGKTGWIVCVDSDGIVWSHPIPEEPGGVSRILQDATSVMWVFVERQHPVRGQGLASTFTLATGYGRILEAVAALGFRYELVRAQDWQRVMLRGEAQGLKGRELMRLYVTVAARLWPRTSFFGPRGGLADGKAAAALIAEYGRRTVLGVTHRTSG